MSIKRKANVQNDWQINEFYHVDWFKKFQFDDAFFLCAKRLDLDFANFQEKYCSFGCLSGILNYL